MSVTTSKATGSGAVLDHEHTNGHHFIAPENVNAAEDRVKFAYWVPNVSGGLVISKIPQRTK
jgi:alkanesulfonate monooxygenase